MKKIFILFAGIGLSLSTFAQQVPNGGFETWTSATNPDGWNTLANAFGPSVSYFAVKDTAPQEHTEGLASLKMTTDSVPGQGTLRSYVGLGTISVATGAPSFSGTPFTRRPDTLRMSYAFFSGNGPSGADSGLVQINLLQAGVSLFGGAKTFYLPPSNGGYGVFPLTSLYTGAGTPDTLSIVFKSGKSAGGTEFGSTLVVDDVRLIDTVVVVNGISDIKAGAAVSAYPNPANSTVNIVVAQTEVGSAIQLIDLAGREVYNGTLSSTSTAIDTRNLESGIYAIRIASNDHLTIFTGKISVAH